MFLTAITINKKVPSMKSKMMKGPKMMMSTMSSDEQKTIVSMSIFGLLISIVAAVIATRCNPDNKLGYGLLAFIFPEIYLIQWAIRKYLMKENEYCMQF